MNKLAICLFFLAMGVLQSCTQKSTNNDYPIISFASEIGKEAVVNLSTIADSISYVPLETSDSALLSRLGFYICEKGKIYVQSVDCLMVFDIKGNYLRTINRKGRGPQEYLLIKRIEVSQDNDNIIILNGIQSLIEYDSTGIFVRKTVPPSVNGFSTFDIYKLSDNLYFSNLIKHGYMPAFSFVLFDSLSNIVKMVPNVDIKNSDSSGYKLIPGIMRGVVFARTFRFGDNLRYCIAGDTVRSIDNKQNTNIEYVYDFGKFGVPMEQTFDLITDGTRINLSGNPLEADDFILFKIYMRDHAAEPFFPMTITGVRSDVQNQTEYAIYDKKKEKLTLMKQPVKEQLGFNNDLDGGPVFWPNYISRDKKMIKLITALEFLELANNPETSSSAMKEVAKNLTEESNPVAVIVRLK